jgi:hypothetical protein
MRRTTALAIVVLLVAATAMSAHVAILTVTNTNDSGPGSLRHALAVSHNGDRIIFTISSVIRLTSGGLVVARNVTISGPGANQLSIDGNQATFVFGVIPRKLSVFPG